MSDQIKIEELKLFVGTGLIFRGYIDGFGIYEEALTSVYPGGFRLMGDFSFTWDYAKAGDIVYPIVRPWSHLTREIEHDGERFVPWRKLHWSSLEAECFDIEDGDLSLEDAQKLASWGFDLFNWLNRTGPDGQPLAVEMEDQ